jgi:hypothetical protein
MVRISGVVDRGFQSCSDEKYMNEYFEYMTGYAVLIVRAYIKMVEFLNSSITTLSNCT